MSCEGCAYAVLLSGMWCCDYLLMTGRRRPGPPGEDCTERKEYDLTKKGSAFMRRRDWDTEKAKALYDQKLTDAEIAGEVGTTASAVAFWRRSLGLPANPGQHSPPWEEPKSKAAPSPPVSPPSQPPVLPANGGPPEPGGVLAVRRERSRALFLLTRVLWSCRWNWMASPLPCGPRTWRAQPGFTLTPGGCWRICARLP